MQYIFYAFFILLSKFDLIIALPIFKFFNVLWGECGEGNNCMLIRLSCINLQNIYDGTKDLIQRKRYVKIIISMIIITTIFASF